MQALDVYQDNLVEMELQKTTYTFMDIISQSMMCCSILRAMSELGLNQWHSFADIILKLHYVDQDTQPLYEALLFGMKLGVIFAFDANGNTLRTLPPVQSINDAIYHINKVLKNVDMNSVSSLKPIKK